jgi:hypothetical protein
VRRILKTTICRQIMKLLTRVAIILWPLTYCNALLSLPPISYQRANHVNQNRRIVSQRDKLLQILYLSSPHTSSDNNQSESEEKVIRTTFDEAGKSLIDEEDAKRMEAMGDYDLNPDVSVNG